jgi:HD-like signal output (HDOD) protein
MVSLSVQTSGSAAGASGVAFEFVKELAGDLSAGKLELPSFPEIALRVRKALANEDVLIEQVVKIISSEPALAARLLQLANSAALSPGGRRVVDLRAAMARIGFNMARSATIAFAMSQLRRAQTYKGLEKPFAELWTQSTHVAAVSFVLARRHAHLNSDAAMLSGLLHGVGKLYILSKLPRFPKLFADPAEYQQLVTSWHANIAKAVLENWEVPEDIVNAVHSCEDGERDCSGPPSLTDVLALARVVASLPGDLEALEVGLSECQEAKQLKLDAATCAEVLRDSAEQIDSLRRALGE